MEPILIGTTDRTVSIFIPDPASTTGAGKTGLNAAALTVTYTRYETDNDVVHSDVTSSLNNLSALTDAHSDWGLIEVNSSLSKGQYRLDLADAVFASGAWYAVVQVTITSGTAAATPLGFRLVAYNELDGVRLGLTALPNAAAEASGGLFTRGTGAGQVNQDANGRLDTNIKSAAGTNVTLDANNVLNVSTKYLGGTLQTARDIGLSVLVGDKTGFKLASDGLNLQTAWTVNITGNLSGSVGSVTSEVSANLTSIQGDGFAAAFLATLVTNYNDDGEKIDAHVLAIANAAITAASIASDAITNAKVAADVEIASVTGAVGSVTSGVTVTTNNDKSGYSISGTVTTIDAFNISLNTAHGAGSWATATGFSTYDGSDTAGTGTLLTRLTANRAGYFDNLNVGGNVASSAETTAIQNNTRVVRVTPDAIELPSADTRTYRIELFLYDDTGNMEAPDSAPTIALVNQAGTDRSGRLDSTTMALVETGRYRAVYTSTAGDTKEQLLWAFSVVEGGNTRKYGNTSYITDAAATDFTSADRAKLDTLHDTRITAQRAANLDNLDATISSRSTLTDALVWAFATRTLTAGTNLSIPTASDNASAVRTNLATELGRIDVAVSTRMATFVYESPPTSASNATAVRSELATELGRIDVATSTRLAPTTSGRTLDITAGGNAGIDWANVESPTTTLVLSGTTVNHITDVTNIVSTTAITTSGGGVAFVAQVTGDINGKVLGGGSGTITGVGARVVDSSGNAVAPASATTLIQAVTDKYATMIVLDGAVYQFTANALELGPTISPSEIATIIAGIVAGLAGTAVNYTGPVLEDGTVSLVEGDDYTSRPFVWTITNYTGPSLSGAAAVLRFITMAEYNLSGSSAAAEVSISFNLTQVGTTVTASVAPTAAQLVGLTKTHPPLPAPNYRVQVRATVSLVTLVLADATRLRMIGAVG